MKKNKKDLLNYTLFLFFICSPIESISIGTHLSLAKIAAIMVLAAWAFKGFYFPKSKMIQAFNMMLAYASLTILWSINRQATFNQIITFLIPSIIVSIALATSIRNKTDIIFYLKGYVIGCVIAAVTGLYFRDAMLAEALYSERITAFGADQNTLAFLLTMGIACLLSYYSSASNKLNGLLSLGGIGVFILMILSTGSRTGLLLMILVIGGYIVSQRSIKTTIIFVVLFVAAIPFVTAYIPDSIWMRFSETNDLIRSGDYSERGSIWEMGINALSQENFILGVGYSNFKNMIFNHYGENWASHNTYLSYFSEFGFFGFFVFLYVVILLVKYTFKIYKVTHVRFIFFYVIPLVVIMFVLETEYKRWLFLLGTLLESWYNLSLNTNKVVKNENTSDSPDVR